MSPKTGGTTGVFSITTYQTVLGETEEKTIENSTNITMTIDTLTVPANSITYDNIVYPIDFWFNHVNDVVYDRQVRAT
jgi:hypothetical protein